MTKNCHGSKDLNCLKMKLKTFREAVWPNGEQPDIELVGWIRLFVTHCLHFVNPMADVSCSSARVREDFFWAVTGLQEWGRKSALLEDEVELEMAAGAPRDAPCEVAKGSH